MKSLVSLSEGIYREKKKTLPNLRQGDLQSTYLRYEEAGRLLLLLWERGKGYGVGTVEAEVLVFKGNTILQVSKVSVP